MKSSVDLLLINPGNRAEQFGALAPLATVAQPLGIALLAAFVRERGISVAILDAEAEQWTAREVADAAFALYTPKVVGLSAFTTKMTAAGSVLRAVKAIAPEVITILGGHHPSALPERTLREEAVDYVIKGEGFSTLVWLVRCLLDGEIPYPDETTLARGLWFLHRDGSVHDGGQAEGIPNLNMLPMAAWDLLPMALYKAHHWQTWGRGLDPKGFALIYTSLGCPFACDYCSVNVVYEKHMVRYRSPAKVVDEIEHLIRVYGVQHFEIIDDTFTVNRKHVEAICDEIISRGLGSKINAWCFSRVDRADARFLSKMKAAGINWVFMGLESGNDTVLLGVNKKQTVVEIREAVARVQAAGIYVGGNFVFGLPEDTQASMQQTLALAQELNTEYANFFVMMAYPGAPLREDALREQKKLPEKWGQYGFFAPESVPLQNATLSAKDILVFRDKAFETYFGSARYQEMVAEKFGAETLVFLREQVLSKKIDRRTTV